MELWSNTVDVIRDSLESIHEDVFQELVNDCVEAVRREKKIIASGLGKNVPICEKFEGTMLSLGMNAFFLHTNSAMHGDLGIVRDGDVIIILSKSGSTVESIELVKHLKMRNITIWLLTFETDSILTGLIQKCLTVKLTHEGDPWNIVPNNSTTINLIILQTLAMSIAEKINVSIEDFKKNHPGGHIGTLLKE